MKNTTLTADFRLTGEFRCQPFGNGGWTLSTRGEREGIVGNDLGAFTTPHDLLAFLSAHLCGHQPPFFVSGDLPADVIEELATCAMQVIEPKGDRFCHPQAPTPPDAYRWRGIGEWFYGPKAPEGVPAQALWTGSAPNFNPVIVAREIVVKASESSSCRARGLGDITVSPAELETIVEKVLWQHAGSEAAGTVSDKAGAEQ